MTTEHIGTRLKNTLNVHVGAEEIIRPRRDHMIVEPMGWNPSEILQVEWHGEPLRGKVLAIGPGCYLIQYASGHPPVWHPVHHPPPKGKRTASRESKIFRPTMVKPGDIVQLGGLEIRGYLFDTLMWGTRSVIRCREEDVVGIERRAA